MKINPDYTEDAVSLAIAMHLTLMHFPRLRFSIEPISRKKERWLAADAKLLSKAKGFLPFYMQFKRPFGHTEPSKARIVKQRKAMSPALATMPVTLYFELLDKQKKQKDYQHNVLFRLRSRLISRKLGDATYVCPLFLNRQAYVFNSHISGLWRWARYWPARPYDLERVVINESSGKVSFDRVPVLSEHVSIPPHKLVTSANHSYSFSEHGDQLCFHSPLSLPEGSQSFSGWLDNLAEQARTADRYVSIQDAGNTLQELLSPTEEDPEFTFNFEVNSNESGIQAWFDFGAHLSETYGIEQYAFILHES